MTDKSKVLFLVAGGSGGHILPALQLGKDWKNAHPDGKILFFSSPSKLEKNILKNNNLLYETVYLKLDNMPGKKLWLYPKFFYLLFLTFVKSFYYLSKYRPIKIISTGGYICVPISILSKIFKTKIDLYELNYVPGKAIKALQKFAENIFIVFDGTKRFFGAHDKKCITCGYPIRFTQHDRLYNKESILNKINFCKNKKTIFLLGGSKGSLYLNKLLKTWLTANKDIINKIQVIHQTGINDKTDWCSFYKDLQVPVIIFSYDQNIKDYYLIADLVISRAGAGTIFELEFFKKKSMIIPLETSYTDHQYDNAVNICKRNKDLFFIYQQKTIEKDFKNFNNKILESLELNLQ